MQTHSYQGLKIEYDKPQTVADNLVVEAPLQININNESYTVVMRTPGDDSYLVRGLLYAEDIYKKSKDLTIEIVEQDKEVPKIINLSIPNEDLGKGYLTKRTLLSVSSCGICGKQELEDIQLQGDQLISNLQFSSNKIFEMFSQLKARQFVFQETGGSHAAAIFNKQYQLLTLKEDIGRHNAVDKCIGMLLTQNMLKSADYLLVSGRVSYEIVSKAFIANIPVIIAVSACSTMAVDYAKELGICLIGFTREQKLTLYSNPNFLNTKAHYEL